MCWPPSFLIPSMAISVVLVVLRTADPSATMRGDNQENPELHAT